MKYLQLFSILLAKPITTVAKPGPKVYEEIAEGEYFIRNRYYDHAYLDYENDGHLSTREELGRPSQIWKIEKRPGRYHAKKIVGYTITNAEHNCQLRSSKKGDTCHKGHIGYPDKVFKFVQHLTFNQHINGERAYYNIENEKNRQVLAKWKDDNNATGTISVPYLDSDHTEQQWDIIPIHRAVNTSVSDFFYKKVKISNKNKALDITGGLGDARMLQFHPWHGDKNQQWTLHPENDGMFSIRSYTKPNFAVDVYHQGVEDGTPLQTFKWHGGNNQKWRVVSDDGNDGFVLSPGHCSKCAFDHDVNNGNGKAEIYTLHGHQNQIMKIEFIDDDVDKELSEVKEN